MNWYLWMLVLWMSNSAISQNNAATTTSLVVPDNLYPISYSVFITVNLEENDFSFSGVVDITVKCQKPTKTIVVNAKRLVIDPKSVTVTENEKPVKVVSQIPDEPNEMYNITTEQDLRQDGSYVVRIGFSGIIDINMAGLYRSSYLDRENKQTRWVALTQFEPNNARAAFPCMDDMRWKSKFTVSVAHHNRYTALGNMPLQGSEKMNDKQDYVVDKFETTPLMCTYIVAFAVIDFPASKPTQSVIPVTAFANKEVISQTALNQEVTAKALSHFAEYFGVAVNIPKLDLVSVHDFAMGAMENLGLFTFREYDSLFMKGASNVNDEINTARISTHEATHLWMGNMVSMKDFRSMWVKEGIATFFEKHALEMLYPNLKAPDPEWVMAFNRALSADGLNASHAIAYTVETVYDASMLYDTITYDKGSLLMRMLFYVVGGDEIFRAIMCTIAEKFQDQVIEMETVWEIFMKGLKDKSRLPSDTSVKDIMDTWTNQRGYPKLIMQKDLQNGKVTITQENFIFNVQDEKDVKKQCWWVPLAYYTKKNPENTQEIPTYLWLSCKQPLVIDIQLEKEEWLILNPRMTVPCRVQYDADTLSLISKTLMDEKTYNEISPMSRAHFISDLAGLTWTGVVAYEVAFETMKLVHFEADYLVLISAINFISGIRFMLSNNGDLTQKYYDWAKTIFEPRYKKDKDINKYPDDATAIKSKALFDLWACEFGAEDQDCINQSVALFKQWMQEPNPDEKNAISPPARYTVFCYAIARIGKEAFDFLLQRYQNSVVQSERMYMIRSFACSQTTELINGLLEASIDATRFGQVESLEIFASTIWNDTATMLIVDFFINRFDDIYKFHGGNGVTMGRYVTAMASRVFNNTIAKRILDLFEQKKDQLAASQIRLNEAKDLIKDNLLFFTRHFEYMKKYFGANDKPATDNASTQLASAAGGGR